MHGFNDEDAAEAVRLSRPSDRQGGGEGVPVGLAGGEPLLLDVIELVEGPSVVAGRYEPLRVLRRGWEAERGRLDRQRVLLLT
jgi:hypothetical protein